MMQRNLVKFLSLPLSIVIFYILLSSSLAFAALNVPIIVKEALPKNISGVDRINEPLTVGIPLLDSDNIRDINQLGLSGASIGQFKVLRKYRSGNIHWVLVDTQISLPANKHSVIHLTCGSGNFGGSNLAQDQGNLISVDTGKVKFFIKKKNFNILQKVIVSGDTFISSENQGSIVAVSDGSFYKSINDPNSTAVIEENGPVKTTVKASGRLLDNKGRFLFNYVCRLYFFKNMSYVKAVVSISNAAPDSLSIKQIEGIWLEIPTKFRGDKKIDFDIRGKRKSVLLRDKFIMYQAFNENKTPDKMYNHEARGRLCKIDGLEITNGPDVLNKLGNRNDFSSGWMKISQPDMGNISFGMKHFDAFWPSGYRVSSDGRIHIELFSQQHTYSNFGFAWGARETRTIAIDFDNSNNPEKSVFAFLKYPIVGRAEYGRYRDAGVFFGEKRLVSYKEQRRFFRDINKDYLLKNRKEYVQRWMSWDREFDHTFCHIINFLRTGFGGIYSLVEDQSRLKADLSVVHSDNFNWLDQAPVNKLDNIPGNSIWKNNFNNCFFDLEHIQDVSLPIFYYISGDEGIRDAIIDHVEHQAWFQDKRGSFHVFTNSLVGEPAAMRYPRWWARALRTASVYYYFLKGDPHFSQTDWPGLFAGYVEHMVKELLRYRNEDKNLDALGWNRDRGFFYKIMDKNIRKTDFMRTTMLTIGAYYAHQVLPDSVLKEDLNDFLIGSGWFNFLEYAPAHQYRYLLDTPNKKGNRWDQLGHTYAAAFENSGDKEILEYARKVIWNEAVYRSYNALAHPAYVQGVIYDWLHQDEIKIGYIEPVGDGIVSLKSSNVTKNRDGSYLLHWKVPHEGLIKYQIKFSLKPIVENLNYNQWGIPKKMGDRIVQSRQYQFDPQKHTNSWAALNIYNEPVPKEKGAFQSVTVNISSLIANYNSFYKLVSHNTEIEYDPEAAYYFAIKYWQRDK